MKSTAILALAFVAPVFAYPITVADSTISGNQHSLAERNDKHERLHTLATIAKFGLEAAEILKRDLGERALFDRGYEIPAHRPLLRRSVDNDFDRRDLDQLETRYFENDLEMREFDDDFLDARALDYKLD